MHNSLNLLKSDLARAILAIVVVQLAYWLAFVPGVLNPPSQHEWNLYGIESAEIAVLDTPTRAAADMAEYTNVELPYAHCCAPFYLSVRYHIQIDTIPPQGIGIIKIMDVDNFILSVNGSIISAPGQMIAGQNTFHGQVTRIDHAPSGLLREGRNTVEFITVRSGLPEASLRTPLIGEYQHMVAGGARRIWVLNDYARYAALGAVIVGFIGLIIMLRSDQKLFAGWLAANGFAWAFYTLFFKITAWPYAGQGRMFFYFAMTYFVPIALYCLIDSWTRRPNLRIQLGLALGWVSALAFSVWRFSTAPMPEGFYTLEAMMNAVLAVMAIAILIRIGVHFSRRRDNRIGEIASLSLCASALALEAWSQITTNETNGALTEVTPVFLIVLLAAFLNRNFHLFRSASDMNTALASQLALRERELSAGHERERELVRRQAHINERQRIVRDMHDGLGSQLMSMLLAAKRGRADPQRVAEGLQAVIDEMRLMIDSMDSVGESLAAALLTFRERVGSRAVDSGWQFQWINTYGDTLPNYPPREILQIFRILQEAVANALKHSNGDTVSVEIAHGDRQVAHIMLRVSDNGSGKFDASQSGRGIANMTMRANSIGGDLEISETATGVTVTLFMPWQGEDEHE